MPGDERDPRLFTAKGAKNGMPAFVFLGALSVLAVIFIL
jgi:hypothetical protein